MKIFYLPLTFFCLLFESDNVDLDTILGKHYAVINQTAKNKLKSISITGSTLHFRDIYSYKSSEPSMKGLFEHQVEKNNSFYEKIEYYDGEELLMTHEYLFCENKAWKKDAFGLNAWSFGSADSINISNALDLESPLYNWKNKGHKTKYLGIREVEDLKYYCIQLVMKDGYIEYDYFYPDSFLLAYRSYYSEYDGSYNTSLYRYSDYKKVHGIPFAHKLTHKVNLMGNTSVTVREVVDISINGKVVKTLTK
jgi:hypothetical protein